jgi:DNA helicase II / ATP-dependent DNA helicase PcrA
VSNEVPFDVDDLIDPEDVSPSVFEETMDLELNRPQAEAVAHTEGPLLVFAGAGSGKTRVITYRIANLIATHQIAPYRILAVTFTNKAAGEMKKRVAEMLGEAIARDLWVGTFHSICAKLLRRNGAPIGLSPNFVIYDSADQKAVVTRALRGLELDDRRYPPKAMLSRIGSEKQEGRRPDAVSINSYLDEAFLKVYRQYEESLAQANAVDFEDLILKMIELLQTNSRESQALRSKFRYILVDEFQDTNASQYQLIKLFSQGTNNLCVVGDDDQSIYRWRGADIRNIRDFRKAYPNARVVKLEENYRSTGRIVAAAKQVVEKSRTREPKELYTKNPHGEPIVLLETYDERDEAAHVVTGVKTTRSEGTPLTQIAVFYRTHAQSRVLEEAMRAANIPYQIVGGMKFYDRAEVKDLIAYMRLLVNPDSDVDFSRIVNVPTRGIGTTTVQKLEALARNAKMSMMRALEAIARGELEIDVASAGRKRLLQFERLVVLLRDHVEQASPVVVFDEILAKSGYRSLLESEDSAEAEARLENLGELRSSLADYGFEAEARGEPATVQGYLERVTLQNDADQTGDQAKITLMTVHSAKGLEFETVFLTGLEEDMFPHRGMNDRGGGFDPEELDEERRLAYVAITRARKRLVMSYARQRQVFGQTRYGIASRFVGEISSDLIVSHKSPAIVSGASYGSSSYGSDYRPTFARAPMRDALPAFAHTGTGAPAGATAGAKSARSPQASMRQQSILSFEDAADANADTNASYTRSTPHMVQRAHGDGDARFVDREYFDDGDEMPIGVRAKVIHARFGEGTVKRMLQLGEPAALVDFPGWGEVKVFMRFLKRKG